MIEIPDELHVAMQRRIACPLPWCDGRYLEHGGDGSGPDDWTHMSREPFALSYGAQLSRVRFGTDPDVWTLTRDTASIAEGESLHDLARMLRGWAEALDLCAASEGTES